MPTYRNWMSSLNQSRKQNKTMRKILLLLLLYNTMIAQKKTSNDFSITINEESINKIITAIGPVLRAAASMIYTLPILITNGP